MALRIDFPKLRIPNVNMEEIEAAFKAYPPNITGDLCQITGGKSGTVQCAVGALLLYAGAPPDEIIEDTDEEEMWKIYNCADKYGLPISTLSHIMVVNDRVKRTPNMKPVKRMFQTSHQKSTITKFRTRTLLNWLKNQVTK